MLAQSTFTSPVGHINVTADGETIVELTMAKTPGPTVGKATVLKEAEKQLTEYFKGKRKEFTFSFEARGTKFQQSVWNEIARIPFGEVLSYADIAREIGKPKASRAVGGAVGSNPIPLLIGCHRVLGASGKITGYSGGEGIPTKRWLLKLEQIETKD
jgi:methylated-DNA-[protein]-cysteine S-methyltransferase